MSNVAVEAEIAQLLSATSQGQIVNYVSCAFQMRQPDDFLSFLDVNLPGSALTFLVYDTTLTFDKEVNISYGVSLR